MPSPQAQRPALLIVDMQVGLFHGPEQPFEGQRVLDNINQLIHRARQAGAPVIAVRHTGPQGSPIAAGSAPWQLLPQLQLEASDRRLDKTRPNCFVGTGLAEHLRAAQVDELVIVGMKTQYCIDATCRATLDLGFAAVLAEDAHTCMDTPALPARAIIDHHNATLDGAFVRRVKTADIRF
ncbi:cysteine hydrolase family protein [Pseudomonas chlororaphis]|uniref:cysteine hydrolase family protein n=1 Tax=Pseudomonas chlororaphis TaxID=587753 RepID=UPI0006A5AB7B|nr:cysteine hydrolase family protein [Pseudomonas chlororaphis]AZD01826.1 Isochorismatase [Pseudomonas chlororaphis subsp. chlororaphis]MBM0283014.1 cysteine hydrolase [Pseudomonas chlororaphis]MDO1507257.1 cysteine hydrolase [Pseudomonas chlororaphis]ORM45452.1 cysteine hydrolase [Pseudomonas chlororaphis subsp. chlororaphis]TWR98661.1 cysteine hydrolase [Pseudomonas chlororaphis subsp. chlororaphis]